MRRHFLSKLLTSSSNVDGCCLQATKMHREIVRFSSIFLLVLATSLVNAAGHQCQTTDFYFSHAGGQRYDVEKRPDSRGDAWVEVTSQCSQAAVITLERSTFLQPSWNHKRVIDVQRFTLVIPPYGKSTELLKNVLMGDGDTTRVVHVETR